MALNSERKLIECWVIFELELNGPSEGNPFVDISLSARFTLEDEKFSVQGFYDANGCIKFVSCPTQLAIGDMKQYAIINTLTVYMENSPACPLRPAITVRWG
jgi:hypothetical protein